MDQQTHLQAIDPVVPGLANPLAHPTIIFQPDVEPVDRRPRLLTIEACAATELVAHAMDYLSDSRDLGSGKIIDLDQNHPDVFALLLLMEAKYHIYISCPVIERRRSTLAGIFKGKDRRRSA